MVKQSQQIKVKCERLCQQSSKVGDLIADSVGLHRVHTELETPRVCFPHIRKIHQILSSIMGELTDLLEVYNRALWRSSWLQQCTMTNKCTVCQHNTMLAIKCTSTTMVRWKEWRLSNTQMKNMVSYPLWQEVRYNSSDFVGSSMLKPYIYI